MDDNAPLKNPSFLIIVAQCFTFIVFYLVIYAIIGTICIALANFIGSIKFLQGFLFVFPINDTIAYTMLPVISAILIYYANDRIYRKYYFHIFSTAIFFMLLSWLTVDHIINMIQKYGAISWNFVNWLWSDVIFIAIIFVTFYKRTKLYRKED